MVVVAIISLILLVVVGVTATRLYKHKVASTVGLLQILGLAQEACAAGRLHEARGAYIEAQRRIARRSTQTPELRQLMGKALLGIGDVERCEGRLPQALAAYRKAADHVDLPAELVRSLVAECMRRGSLTRADLPIYQYYLRQAGGTLAEDDRVLRFLRERCQVDIVTDEAVLHDVRAVANGLLPHAGELPWLHVTLGIASRRLGDLESAVSSLARAQQLLPGDASVALQLALAHHACGNLDRAIACAHRSIETDPQQPEAYYELAHLLYDQAASAADATAQVTLLSAALPAAQRACELGPGNGANWRLCGQLALCLGDLALAADALWRAPMLAPNGAAVHFCLARLHVQACDYSAAARSYRAGIARDHNWLPAYVGLGIAEVHAGSTSTAISVLREALHRQGEHEEALLYLGIAYAQAGRWDEALVAWQRLHMLRPGDAALAENVALALHHGAVTALDAGRYADAIDAWTQCLALRPDEQAFAQCLAEAHVRAGMVRAHLSRHVVEQRTAYTMLDRAAALDPYDWRPGYYRGLAALAGRDSAAAIAALEPLVASSVADGRAAYHLALVYLSVGDPDAAKALLTEVGAARTDFFPGSQLAEGNIALLEHRWTDAFACFAATIQDPALLESAPTASVPPIPSVLTETSACTCSQSTCSARAYTHCAQCGGLVCSQHGRIASGRVRCITCLVDTFERVLDCSSRAGEIDRAVEVLTPWTLPAVSVPELGWLLGLAWAEQQQFERAIPLLESLYAVRSTRERATTLANVLVRCAARALDSDDAPTAARDLQRAVELNPQLAIVQTVLPLLRAALALAHIADGKPEAALALWEDALAQQPGDLQVIHQLGILYYRLASGQEASEPDPRNQLVEDGDHVWHRTIACWATLLCSEPFWRQWDAQRSSVGAGLTLSVEAVREIRSGMRQRITSDLRTYAANATTTGGNAQRFQTLEQLWLLELEVAQRVPEFARECNVPGWPDGFGCGPLMQEWLGTSPQGRLLTVPLLRAIAYSRDSVGQTLQRYLSPVGRYQVLLDVRRMDEAISGLEAAQNQPAARTLLGIALATRARDFAEAREWEAALAAFERAGQCGTALQDDADLIARTAEQYARQWLDKHDDDYDKPIAMLERALALVGRHSVLTANLAALHAQKSRIANNAKRYEEAIQQIRIALSYGPEDATVRHFARVGIMNLALSLDESQADRKLTLMKEALTYEHDAESAKLLSTDLFSLALDAARRGEQSRAVDMMRESGRYSPEGENAISIEYARSTLMVGLSFDAAELVKAGDSKGALARLVLAEHYGTREAALDCVMQILTEAKCQPVAIPFLQEYLKRHRSASNASHWLHIALHNHGLALLGAADRSQAIVVLQQALQIEHAEDTRRLLGRAYGFRAVQSVERRDLAAAKADLRQAVQLDPTDGDWLRFLTLLQ